MQVILHDAALQRCYSIVHTALQEKLQEALLKSSHITINSACMK